MDTKDKGFNTKLIHSGTYQDEFRSAVTPIYQTSTFGFDSAQHGADLFAKKGKGYIYTRLGNPTIDVLEKKLADLEHGAGSVVFASGMAAVSTVFAAFLKQGDHMISGRALYGPSRMVMETLFAGFGVESDFIDATKVEHFAQAIRPNTKLIYLETPSNPTMELTDIEVVSRLAHQRGILVCVDNTFSSPHLQNPIDLGVDLVLHSMTKFINGHADIVAGAVITKTTELRAQVHKTMTFLGGNMDPHQAYMVIRGVKTLAVRMERAQKNAQKIAEYLEVHPKVAWVLYPGLKSFPQYELAQKQMKGSGAMISFGLKGGYQAGVHMMNHVKMALLAVSLGGIETLIQHPASMTHASIPKAEREEAGITDEMVRFSVGIEDVEDIISDLEQAMI